MDFFIQFLHNLPTEIYNTFLYLFDDNGILIIRWYLIMIVIDTILGTVKSAKKSRLKSRTYLYGIFLKILGIMLIIVANGIDDMFTIYMKININFDVSDATAVGMVVYEAQSIVENMRDMGIFTGKMKNVIDKYFDSENKNFKK